MRSRLAALGGLFAVIAIVVVLSMTLGSWNVSRVDASAKTFDATLQTTGMVDELSSGASLQFAKYEYIDGESMDTAHPDWIAIQSIEWGAHSQPFNNAARANIPSIDSFVITFVYEKAAPKIAEACLTGQMVGNLQVELTNPGDTSQVYLRYDLHNVQVVDYGVSSDPEGRMLVTVANRFGRIGVTYWQYDAQGQIMGTSEFTYDTVTHKTLAE